MLDLRITLIKAHEILKNQNIAHALIGEFALAVYGYHRATVDIEIIADGAKKEIIKHQFVQQGFLLRYESEEVLQFSGPGLIDIILANRPLSQEMLKQAIESKELGVSVLRAEDLIGLKIQAYKNDPSRMHQDKADIQLLLKLPDLVLARVKKYADLFSEWTEIEELNRTKA